MNKVSVYITEYGPWHTHENCSMYVETCGALTVTSEDKSRDCVAAYAPGKWLYATMTKEPQK